MGWLSFAIWIAIGLIIAGITCWLAAGRSKAAQIWAEIAATDPAFGALAILAILFTKKTRPRI